jgi:hypothetical protein
MKSTMGFIAFAAILLLLLFLLSSGRKAPDIPVDVLHRVITTDAACTECHAPGKAAPLKPSHPPKEQCMICHRVKG